MRTGKSLTVSLLAATLAFGPTMAQATTYHSTPQAAAPIKGTGDDAAAAVVTGVILAGLAYCMFWGCSSSSGSSSETASEGGSSGLTDSDYVRRFQQEPRPSPEYSAPPAPAISPLYDVSKGVGE